MEFLICNNVASFINEFKSFVLISSLGSDSKLTPMVGTFEWVHMYEAMITLQSFMKLLTLTSDLLGFLFRSQIDPLTYFCVW